MQIHKTYTSLYEPIYVFNVPPKVFVKEALGTVLFFFVCSLILSYFMEMILSLGLTLIICLFAFFSVHAYASHKYKTKGFYWRDEAKFYKSIPYKKIFKKGRAYLP